MFMRSGLSHRSSPSSSSYNSLKNTPSLLSLRPATASFISSPSSLTPCWSPGAHREHLLVSPTYHSLLLSNSLGGLLSVKSEFPRPFWWW